MGWLEDELQKDKERSDLESKQAELQEQEFSRLESDFSRLFESISKITAGLSKLGYRFGYVNRRQIEGKGLEIFIQFEFRHPDNKNLYRGVDYHNEIPENTDRSLRIGFCASSKGLIMTVDTEGKVHYTPYGLARSHSFLPDQSADLEAKFDEAFSSCIEFVRVLTKEEKEEREFSWRKMCAWEWFEESRLSAEYEQKLKAWESEERAWVEAYRLEALPIEEANRQQAIQWGNDRKENERTWDLEEKNRVSQKSIWERVKEIFKKEPVSQNPFRPWLNDNPFSNISVPLPSFPVPRPSRVKAPEYTGVYFLEDSTYKPIYTPKSDEPYHYTGYE